MYPLTIGTCRFCGQLNQISGEDVRTQGEAEELATRQCGCDEAAAYRQTKQIKKEAIQNVRKLFGELAPERERADERVVTVIIYLTELVCAGLMQKASVDIGGGIKVAISMNRKGEVKIKRTETHEQEMIG